VLKETLSGGSYMQSTVASGLDLPQGVAVDGIGNVYIADTRNNRVLEENVVTPPSLSFASTAFGALSGDSPQTVAVANNGNADLSFSIPASGNNPAISGSAFSLDAATTCPQLNSSSAVAGVLAAGATCNYAMDFTPTVVGLNSGTLTLTDNNLNASSATQAIGLSGTGTQSPQTITFTSPGTGPEVRGGMVMVSATGGGSGNPVEISSMTPLVCTVPGGTASSPATVSLIAPGTCTLAANQAGNTDYSAAPQVTLTFTVTPVFVLTVKPSTTTATRPGNESVVLTLSPVNRFKGSVTLNCTLPGGLPSGAKCPGLPVTVTLNGNSAVNYSTGVLFPTGTKAGTYVVTFTAVDGKFNDSTTGTFMVK
jgi:hypothetical protein